MKHRHHIVPLHEGGQNDENNIVELSIEEHAEAHKILWEKNHKWQDYLAWQGLANLMTKEELVKSMLSLAGRKGSLSNSKRKGMKYKKHKMNYKPIGTSGRIWFHDPNDPTKKACLLPSQNPPDYWIRGQGKKNFKKPTS